MSHIPNRQPDVKGNPRSEKEILLAAMRAASSRTRLWTNTIDSAASSLKHGALTAEQALEWCAEEGVLDLIQLPKPADGGAK